MAWRRSATVAAWSTAGSSPPTSGARGLGLVLDLARAVGDEGGDGGVAAAVLPGAPRVGVLAPVEGQEGKALLVVLDVADAADGAPHLPARRDPVPEAEGADGAHHR